jgi:hypothetical protein
MRSKFELSQVVKLHWQELNAQHALSGLQLRVLSKITQCRTSVLGGHEQVCDTCGTLSYSYNSCGDRHCPKCQAAKQAFWVEDLAHNTLKVKHFHVVFTVPHCLNALCLHQPKLYYDLLFASVWNTLQSMGYSHYGVESGAIAVLHTWGQNLSLHPHIHCLVPAAGLALNGQWKHIGHDGTYLYPVHQLSTLFKGKFLDSLKRALKKQNLLHGFNATIQQAYATKWVVHSQASMAGAEQVIKYLGQYTHRVAISNDRILNIANGKVTFIAKDYKDNAIKKPITLDGVEFLRRFCMHILPRRFVKIRRYGIYNHTTKRSLNIQFEEVERPTIDSLLQKENVAETTLERLERITGFNTCACPVCKIGTLQKIRELPRVRSPTHMLFLNNNSFSKQQ